MNPRLVRCFGRLVDPSAYRAVGWTGWLLDLVNTVRVWLEHWQALRIVHIEAQCAGLSGNELKRFDLALRTDPETRPWFFREEAPRIRHLHLEESQGFVSPEERRVAHYEEGRANATDDLATTFATFLVSKDGTALAREARYHRGRRGRVLLTEAEAFNDQ